MGVPLEWNVFMIFGILTLFVDKASYGLGRPPRTPCRSCCSVSRRSSCWATCSPRRSPSCPACATTPATGTRRSGASPRGWRSSTPTPSRRRMLPHQQLEKIYGKEEAEVPLFTGYAFRAIHTHGRAHFALIPRLCGPEHDTDYLVMDGELIAGVVLGLELRGRSPARRTTDHRAPGSVRLRARRAARAGARRPADPQAHPGLPPGGCGDRRVRARHGCWSTTWCVRQPWDTDLPITVTSGARPDAHDSDTHGRRRRLRPQRSRGRGPPGPARRPSDRPGGPLDDRRRDSDCRAHRARPRARRLLRGASVRRRLAVPLAAATGQHGLIWRWPEIDLAHPLDDGTAGVLEGDVARLRDASVSTGTAGSGSSARTRAFPTLAADALGPLLRVPSHPVRLAQFGLRAAPPASVLARRFRTPQAQALFLGCAAHLFQPLTRPLSSSVGAMMIAAGHRHGWPVRRGRLPRHHPRSREPAGVARWRGGPQHPRADDQCRPAHRRHHDVRHDPHRRRRDRR